jgi:hypothetical protein
VTHGIGSGLNGQQGDLAAKFMRQIPGQDVERQGMGRGAQTFRLAPVKPANRPGRVVHIGGVYQNDKVGMETADVAGKVFGRRTHLQNEHAWLGVRRGRLIACKRASQKAAHNANASRVVAAQLVADAEHGDAREAISAPK